MSEENKMPPQEIPNEQPASPAGRPVNNEPTDETISSAAKTSEIINPTSEIKDMEVHHHTHPAHGKKNWKSYFWEFLMLFLAVFCGFLAENQREHLIEHKREKVYMVSMLEDIRADTAMLNLMHTTFSGIAKHIDSLIPLLQPGDIMEKNAAQIYQHQIWLTLFARWRYSDRTISQLKNSGNFRLIRKQSVSDLIIAYDGYVKSYVDNMQGEYVLPLWRAMNEASVDIFKSGVVRKKFNTSSWYDTPIQLPEAPFFITGEKYTLQKFANRLNQYALAIEWGNINIKNALGQAVKIDSLIKKEYHLE